MERSSFFARRRLPPSRQYLTRVSMWLPRNCSAAWPDSEARQPKSLASHALLHGVSSCTSSPELPPVAYEIDAVSLTLFGLYRVLPTPSEHRKRGCWKHKLENASLSRNLRAMVRSVWNRDAAPRVSLVRRENKGAWCSPLAVRERSGATPEQLNVSGEHGLHLSGSR